uniref:ANF_receptor domain-containing protein n=1 Tax=Caenorhabditis japonica TaxID=281687 RepID=A0A8R1E8X7_CAEJA
MISIFSEFIPAFDECDESLAGGKTTELLEVLKVDLILGPTCNRPAVIASALASYYNIPILEWGLTTSQELADRKRFTTSVPFSVNSYSLALAIRSTLLQFEWSQYVYLYSNDGDNEKCESLKNDIQVNTDYYIGNRSRHVATCARDAPVTHVKMLNF